MNTFQKARAACARGKEGWRNAIAQLQTKQATRRRLKVEETSPQFLSQVYSPPSIKNPLLIFSIFLSLAPRSARCPLRLSLVIFFEARRQHIERLVSSLPPSVSLLSPPSLPSPFLLSLSSRTDTAEGGKGLAIIMTPFTGPTKGKSVLCSCLVRLDLDKTSRE